MAAVHRYEGTVNQVMGDGIMALFGAPVAHEDHAVRACYAALRMQETVQRYAEDVRRTQGITRRASASGSTPGRSSCARSASDLRMEYTAVGQTTHLAARMEQIADARHDPHVTPNTLALVEGHVDVRSLGPRAREGPRRADRGVRGLGRLDRALAPSRGGRARSDAVRRARIEEIQQLHDAARARARRPRDRSSRRRRARRREVPPVLRVHASRTATHGCLVIESVSVSYGKATAYLPIIDLLKAYFRIDAPRRPAERPRQGARAGSSPSAELLEPIRRRPLPPRRPRSTTPKWQRIDPPQRRQPILDGVAAGSCARPKSSPSSSCSRISTGSTPRRKRSSMPSSTVCPPRAC